MYDTRAMNPGELATEARARVLSTTTFVEDLLLSSRDPVPPEWAVAGGSRGHGGTAEWTDEREALVLATYEVPRLTENPVIKVAGPEIALLLLNAARDFDSLAERLEPGDCWGHSEESRTADGRPTGHSLGKAVCLNARWHPPGRRGMTPFQQALCQAIAEKYGLIWGGDDTSVRRICEGHFEFGGTISTAEAKIEELRAAYALH